MLIPKGYTITVRQENNQNKKKKKFIKYIKNFFEHDYRSKSTNGTQRYFLRGLQAFYSSEGKEFCDARVISEMKPEIRSYYGYNSME